MSEMFDLVVIGLGPAGTLAAEFASRELGLRVAAVECNRRGGDSLWTGSVPSKALLASARAAHVVATAGDYGISSCDPVIDLAAVWRRVNTIRTQIAAKEVDRLTEVEILVGQARITGARQVTVATPEGITALDTRYILVCTGSRPRIPEIAGLATVPYLTTDRLFELDRPPESILIVGGGPVAAELAQALVRLGVGTTVVGANPRLLPRDEPELSDRLASRLRREGVHLHLGTTVTAVRRTSDAILAEAGDLHLSAAGILIATGRVANVEQLGLETLGIRTGPDGVTVDGRSRTIVPSIYVVGDAAAGRLMFTHSSTNDAVFAVRDMFFPGRGLAAGLVPWCTFTDPELAHVGLTAAEARDRFGRRHVEVLRHEFADNLRARADGHTEGALIVVTAKRRIVGAHALGPSAGELIHELTMTIRLGLKLSDLGSMVHVHPTYSSGIAQLVAESAFRTGRRYRRLARLTRWLG
jgi:pyruvate/2-oxoglutarate dehydrogenase complex dihydrolipoamide dehydrogenase (E3) component